MGDILDSKGIVGALLIGIVFIFVISFLGGKDSETNKAAQKTLQLKNVLATDSIFYNADKIPAIKYHYADLDSINNYYKKIDADKIVNIGEIQIAEFKENNCKFYHLNRKGKNEIYTFFRPIITDSQTISVLKEFYINEPNFKSVDKILTK